MAGLDALLSTLHPPSRENWRMTRSRTGSLHLRSYGTFIRYSLPAFTGAFPDHFFPQSSISSTKSVNLQTSGSWTRHLLMYRLNATVTRVSV